MLSAAKHLAASRDRPFAALRVTRGDCSHGQGLFFKLNHAYMNNDYQEVLSKVETIGAKSVFFSTAYARSRDDFGQHSIVVVPGCAIRPMRKVYKEFDNTVARSQGQFSGS